MVKHRILGDWFFSISIIFACIIYPCWFLGQIKHLEGHTNKYQVAGGKWTHQICTGSIYGVLFEQT